MNNKIQNSNDSYSDNEDQEAFDSDKADELISTSFKELENWMVSKTRELRSEVHDLIDNIKLEKKITNIDDY